MDPRNKCEDDSGGSGSARADLHLAVGEVGVGVLLQADADDPVGQHAVLLHHLADVDVLDRVVAGVELEAADRKSGGSGKSVSIRVELGGRRTIKKKRTLAQNQQSMT